MKQNKRFILLVVMVLLANCLFAGLASAADPQNIYARPANYDGTSNPTTSSFTKSVSSGDISGDKVIGNGGVTINLVDAIHDPSLDVASTNGNIVVAYTFPKGTASSSQANKWKITTNNESKVALTGTVSGNDVTAAAGITANILDKAGTSLTLAIADENGKFDTTGAKSISFTLKAAVKAPTALSLTKVPDKTFNVGKTYAFTANLAVAPTPADASADFTVTSSEPTVISVNANKDLTALKEGKSTITVTSTVDTKVSAKLEVTVEKAAATKPVKKITFTAKELNFDVSKTSYTYNYKQYDVKYSDHKSNWDNVVNLKSYLTVEPSDYDTPTSIVWKVDNDLIADVDFSREDKNISGTATSTNKSAKTQYALVYPTSNAVNGTVNATVTITNADGTTVTSDPIAITFGSKISTLDKVTMSSESLTMYYIDKDNASTDVTLSAVAKSDTDISSAMTWSWATSDPSVVVFESNKGSTSSGKGMGNSIKLRAAGAGKATITATADDGKVKKSATCEVIVTGTSPDLTLTDAKGNESTTVYLEKGKTSTLKLTCSKKNVEWSSEDETIATVKDGVVTIVGKGKTHIIAKAGDKAAVFGINAKQGKAKITIENKSVEKGEKAVLFSIDKNAYDKTATVTVEDPSILKVNEKTGKMTGKAVGKTKVTIKTADKTKTVTVKVTK
jgi:uncharacterized protein YjdB